MAESHTKQNRFAGSYIKQRRHRGGLQTVTERQVLGGGDPMYDGVNERLKQGDLKGFSKPIRDLIIEIVNDFHVRCRVIDGAHIMLYPPDGQSRPFKVSAARQDKVNKQILEVQFMQEYGLVRKKDQPPEESQETAVEEQPEETSMTAAMTETTKPEAEVIHIHAADHTDKVRRAISLLSEALGVDSLEEEALQALEENESLTEKVRSLTEECARHRSVAEAERREAERWRQKSAQFEQLMDEAVARADAAEKKIATLREVFQ